MTGIREGLTPFLMKLSIPRVWSNIGYAYDSCHLALVTLGARRDRDDSDLEDRLGLDEDGGETKAIR